MSSERLMATLQQGYQAQQAGKLSDAERCYQQVLAEDGHNLHGLNLMGMLCVNSARPKEAVDYLVKALAQSGANAQTHANLALALKDLGQLPEAIEQFKQSLAIDPNNPVVHNNLGNVLRAANQNERAARSFEQGLKLKQDYAECWSNFAAALNDLDRTEPAFRAVQNALNLQPEMAQAHNNLGDIFLKEAKYSDAFSSYQRASQLDPKYTVALINMAKVQRDMDQSDEALSTLNEVLKLEPDNAEAHHALGVLREQIGSRGLAAESFQAAIEALPTMTIAHYQLAQIKGRKSREEEITAMKSLWLDQSLTGTERMYLGFGLAKSLEQGKDYDGAYEYLAAANKIKAERSPYDDAQAESYIQSLIVEAKKAVAFVPEKLSQARQNTKTCPVFVVGMPRSGTSLTEQILASHSEIAGAGELSFGFDTAKLCEKMTGKKFPAGLKDLNSSQRQELGDYYLDRHNSAYMKGRYVVDKTPLNFQYLGLFSLILPEAKFIHCHREPVGNCFAIHKLPFDEKQTYAHSLESLGQYYHRYWALMQAWHQLFPGRIYDACYEDTVQDIDSQSKRLAEFLNIGFETQMLDFHKTERLVKTPSASQVREPIYKDSVAAWKPYEKHLAPLIASLGNFHYEH